MNSEERGGGGVSLQKWTYFRVKTRNIGQNFEKIYIVCVTKESRKKTVFFSGPAQESSDPQEYRYFGRIQIKYFTDPVNSNPDQKPYSPPPYKIKYSNMT